MTEKLADKFECSSSQFFNQIHIDIIRTSEEKNSMNCISNSKCCTTTKIENDEGE